MGGSARANILKPGVTLFIVRHGETDWNRDSRYQGQRDIPLNETGRQQARRQGRALKAPEIDAAKLDFVSSPLWRAIETMQIIREELSLSPEDFRIEPELTELKYGHWEGVLATDLPMIDPVGLAEKNRDPFGWRPREGESYRDLAQRISVWLGCVERDAVVVTHGGVSRVIRGALYAIEDAQVPFLDSPQDKILKVTAEAMDWI